MGSAPNVTQKLTTYSCGGGEAAMRTRRRHSCSRPTANGNYRIDVDSANGERGPLRRGCAELQCGLLEPEFEKQQSSGRDESLVLAATAGTTYYIVIDGYTATADFTLGVTQL